MDLSGGFMRFYGRSEELATLRGYLEIVRKKAVSQMVSVVGRRRVGKTTLILKAFEEEKKAIPVFYFFVERQVVAEELIQSWVSQICQAYEISFRPAVSSLSDVIRFLMSVSRNRECVCILDECQEIDAIDSHFWTQLQKIWDLNKSESKVLLVMSGSILSAMARIFEDPGEPLYGRLSCLIRLKAFTPSVVKKIVLTENKEATARDLLFLYALTGGVAEYLTLLSESDSLSERQALDYLFSLSGTWLRFEGELYLANEFRVQAPLYTAILRAVSSGATKWNEIESRIPQASQLSPYMARLLRFGIIEKTQPLFQAEKANSRKKTRYVIADPYFRFYLTFIAPAEVRSMTESGNWRAAKAFCSQRLDTFLGRVLEQWFRARYAESHEWNCVGRWWDKKGENEIDLVAVNSEKQSLEVAEVKLNPEKYSQSKLESKVQVFLAANPRLEGFKVKSRLLSLRDM